MNAVEIKVNIDDSYMNVTKFGNGNKNLVIIAGISLLGIEGQGNAIAEAYKIFGEEYTVYVIERKKELADGYSVQQMAEDVCRVLSEIGISKIYLYGVSQGGMIAQCIAAYHPEMVEKMVICSSQCRVTNTAKDVIKKWIQLAEEKNVININRSFSDTKWIDSDIYGAIDDSLSISEKDDFCRDVSYDIRSVSIFFKIIYIKYIQ